MPAVLIGTDGSSKGRLVLLGRGEVSVGRDDSNTVAIDDVAVGRRHFVIQPSGEERFKLTDLQSRNGTFVNGALVRERLLEHNDEIRVGGSAFRFQEQEQPAADKDAGGGATATLLRSGESIFLNPRKLEETLPLTDRTARGVHVLLRISQALQVTQSLEALERQLLELLFEAVPAERGSIVLSRTEEGVFTLHRGGGPGEVPRIAPAVSRQVLEERVAVLDKDENLHLIAVPLTCLERVEGLLYLDGSVQTAAFDEGHLQLVSAMGSIAGMAIHNLLQMEDLRSENRRLEEEIRIEHNMVGSSDALREIHRFIARVAPASSTVLIGGESGTGKELVARAIHHNSPRKAKPFVAINCAALTETLLESELFGHERGSFTGAVGMKKGKFEVADGGTLFLDEIGELAQAMQAKLLRVLQQHEFERVGGTRSIPVDVRIVAASNRDLEAAARANTFRQDLYFRLNVISVTMPPLREHREDIPLLAAHFADKFGKLLNRQVSGISERARAALMKYDWPGNVRELENAIERAVVLGASDQILPEDLPEAVIEAVAAAPSGASGSYQEAVVEAKRRVVREALERAGGVYTEAARLLDVHPNYLHRLVRNLQLR